MVNEACPVHETTLPYLDSYYATWITQESRLQLVLTTYALLKMVIEYFVV